MTQEMLVTHGIKMVQITGDFEKALLEWFELDDNEKTWLRFKRYFTTGYKVLCKVRGKTIQNTHPFFKQMHWSRK